jgi:hypothetical protein
MDSFHAENTVRGLVERYTEDPPDGVDPTYVASFADRRWVELVGMAEEAYEQREGQPRTRGFCPVCFYTHELLDGRVVEHPPRSPVGMAFPSTLLGEITTVCPGSSYPSYGESPAGSAAFLETVRAELKNARQAFVAAHAAAPESAITRNARLDVEDTERLERRYQDFVEDHEDYAPRYLAREREESKGSRVTQDTGEEPCVSEFVPAPRIPRLQARVDALNGRAKRLKQPPLVLTVDTDNPKERKYYEEWDEAHAHPKTVTEYEVTLCGHRPKLAGWMLVGVLDHKASADPNQPLIYSFGYKLPPRFEAAGPFCEHCSSKRLRNMTFVLLHDDGRMIQVGSSCLQDFLGGVSPAAMVAYASLLPSLRGFFSDDWDDSMGAEPVPTAVYLPFYLALVAKIIRESGWVSKAKAGFNQLSTSQNAEIEYLKLVGPKQVQVHGQEREKLTPKIEDRDEAEATIAWARGDLKTYARSDYEINLKRAMGDDYVGFRALGIVASAVAAYRREMQRRGTAGHAAEKAGRALDKKAPPTMAEVQARYPVGLRVTLKVTLLRAIPQEGDYGLTIIHGFEDEYGSKLTWFASGKHLTMNRLDYHGPEEHKVEVGETVEITGTVKGVKEYKGAPDVALTRVVAPPDDPYALSAPIKGKGAQVRKARRALLWTGYKMETHVPDDLDAEGNARVLLWTEGTPEYPVRVSVVYPAKPYHTFPIERYWTIIETPDRTSYWFSHGTPDNFVELITAAAPGVNVDPLVINYARILQHEQLVRKAGGSRATPENIRAIESTITARAQADAFFQERRETARRDAEERAEKKRRGDMPMFLFRHFEYWSPDKEKFQHYFEQEGDVTAHVPPGAIEVPTPWGGRYVYDGPGDRLTLVHQKSPTFIATLCYTPPSDELRAAVDTLRAVGPTAF